MNEGKQNSKSKHAFSLNRYQNQSPFISLLTNSKALLANSNTKLNVCTRNRPFKNTFDQNIVKRFRAKNKMNSIPLQSNQTLINTHGESQPSHNSVTIGIQTENLSNMGKGTEPLNPNRVKTPIRKCPTGQNPNPIIRSSQSFKWKFHCRRNQVRQPKR